MHCITSKKFSNFTIIVQKWKKKCNIIFYSSLHRVDSFSGSSQKDLRKNIFAISKVQIIFRNLAHLWTSKSNYYFCLANLDLTISLLSKLTGYQSFINHKLVKPLLQFIHYMFTANTMNWISLLDNAPNWVVGCIIQKIYFWLQCFILK